MGMTKTQAIESNPAAFTTTQRANAVAALRGMQRHFIGVMRAQATPERHAAAQSKVIYYMQRANALESAA